MDSNKQNVDYVSNDKCSQKSVLFLVTYKQMTM